MEGEWNPTLVFLVTIFSTVHILPPQDDLETNTHNLNIWVNTIYFNEIVMDNKRKSELLKSRFYSLLANFKKDIENLNS